MSTITTERVIEAARSLDKPEFSRAEIAEQLGADRGEIKGAFKQARKNGAVEKTGEDKGGKGRFRLSA